MRARRFRWRRHTASRRMRFRRKHGVTSSAIPRYPPSARTRPCHRHSSSIWTCDFEMRKSAPISRIVRFVRSATATSRIRQRSECAHGRPWSRPAPEDSSDAVDVEGVQLVHVRPSRYDLFVVESTKRTRGPNKQTPWAWQPSDGFSVLRLALDVSDPLQRGRLESVFSAAFQLRRALQRDVRDRIRAYWAAWRERERVGSRAALDRVGLSRTALEHRAYEHLDRAPHLRHFVTKALAMHLADSVWTPAERHLFGDARGKRQGIPGVGRWFDFARLPGRARSHTRPRKWETFRLHGSLAGHRAAYTGDNGRFFQPRRMRPVAQPDDSWWSQAGALAMVFTGLAGGDL